jgi:hypothetical protein
MYRLTAHTRLHTGIQCTVQTYCTHSATYRYTVYCTEYLSYGSAFTTIYRLTAHTRLHTGIQCTLVTYSSHSATYRYTVYSTGLQLTLSYIQVNSALYSVPEFWASFSPDLEQTLGYIQVYNVLYSVTELWASFYTRLTSIEHTLGYMQVCSVLYSVPEVWASFYNTSYRHACCTHLVRHRYSVQCTRATIIYVNEAKNVLD